MKRQPWDLGSPEGEVKVVDLYIWHDEEYSQALDAAVAGNFEWYSGGGMVRYVLYKLEDLWTFVLRNSVTV